MSKTKANQGKILWWDKRDGNGIIKLEDNTKLYFDQSVVKGFEPKAGMMVSFKVNKAIESCLCAKDVVLE